MDPDFQTIISGWTFIALFKESVFMSLPTHERHCRQFLRCGPYPPRSTAYRKGAKVFSGSTSDAEPEYRQLRAHEAAKVSMDRHPFPAGAYERNPSYQANRKRSGRKTGKNTPLIQASVSERTEHLEKPCQMLDNCSAFCLSSSLREKCSTDSQTRR